MTASLPSPSMPWPRILVTGASGFVGAAMAEALHAAGAMDLRAGVARWPSKAPIASLPITIVHCDLLQAETLDVALQGIEVVIHCARIADDAKFIEGTRRLLERARAAGVRKVVHLSSVAVYGEAEGRVDEDTPASGHITAYGRGKIASEDDCKAAAGPDMAVSVIRPALIYGPMSELWTMPYLRRLPSGRWPFLGEAGRGRANLLHVDDLARFIAFLATHEVGAYAVFNANGPETPTWNGYLDRFSDALGVARPDRERSVSRFGAVWRRPLRVALRKSRALGNLLAGLRDELDLYPTTQEMDLFKLDVVYATDRAKAAGFEAAMALDQGLANCVAWARREGN